MSVTKSMKTIFSTVAVCTVVAFTNIATVNASDKDTNVVSSHQEAKHQGYKHHGYKNKIKHMTKALSLNEGQQVQIKAIKMKTKEQHKALRASMKEYKIAEKKLLQTKVFDEKAFNTLHNSYQSTFTQLALTRAKSKHAIFNILTTEQQDKWLKMIEHKKGKGDKKGRGKKHGKKVQD